MKRKKPTSADLERWLRKARRVFKMRTYDGAEQWDRGCDLARDIHRTLDPEGWKKQ